jgi:hypothetical protein
LLEPLERKNIERTTDDQHYDSATAPRRCWLVGS